MTTTTLPPDIQPELFTGFRVRIEIFEGPLDLLLHLVRRSELDIHEVRVSDITRQYLEFLRTMQELNIEVTGEFLVLAATLLLIKSRQLLPRQEEAVEETELQEAEEALTFQAELQERLEQYRTFKEAAAILRESRELRQQMHVRYADEGQATGPVYLEGASVFDIVAVFQQLLSRAAEKPTHFVEPDRVSVADQIRFILDTLREAPDSGLTFHEILSGGYTRLLVVVTFLAVLELIRRRRLVVRQERIHGEIYVQLHRG